MGDENLIRTLRDYSKPSHEGYKNTIELPEGNNVVPLQSDTIRLVQNGCSFHGLRSEDPINALRIFKIHFHMEGFYYSFPSSILSTGKDLLQKVPHHGIDLWLQVQIFYDHVNPVKRRTIDQSVGGKLRDRNVEESWALLEDLALYDNKSWNDPRDFAKPVKAISFSQDVSSTFDLNKISSSCEICSGPHDTQYCMKNPEQAFVDYASSRIDEVGGRQKVFSEKLDDTSTRDTAGDSIAHVNAASIDQIEKEDLQNKGIKSLSKLLSLKYLSQASIEEQNKNPSSPKRVHFINSVFILCKEDEVRERWILRTVLGQQVVVAYYPKIWPIATKKITYLDRTNSEPPAGKHELLQVIVQYVEVIKLG
ncbi:hypothetical protein Tco_1385166 [Tanacetum coccineum]